MIRVVSDRELENAKRRNETLFYRETQSRGSLTWSCKILEIKEKSVRVKILDCPWNKGDDNEKTVRKTSIRKFPHYRYHSRTTF